jgi:hypothetical protein
MSNNASTEHSTPGDYKRLGSGAAARKDSVSKLKNSNSEVNNLLQDAEEEAMVLSLDPKAAKKKKPTKLKPIMPSQKLDGTKTKIEGNYAAQVLAELEAKDKNKQINHEMKKLDREISNFMNLDTNDLTLQMNNAFDGKKDSWRDKLA